MRIKMAYDELLADRVRIQLERKGMAFEEKKMMGGVAFMVDDKMCVGLTKNELMARIGPDKYDMALQLEGCKEMKFTGRPMRGFVFVEPEALDRDDQLEYWVQLCLEYNPLAKRSKKRTRK
jgi:TfoX/Sxy family transcriptional regulator of competence genes